MVDDQSNQDELADQVLAKLRSFVESLEPDERTVLAALLAPGVASAYEDADVSGFAAGVDWTPQRLPEALAERVRSGRVRVEVE